MSILLGDAVKVVSTSEVGVVAAFEGHLVTVRMGDITKRYPLDEIERYLPVNVQSGPVSMKANL